MCDEKTVEYLRDLIAEKHVIEEHITKSLANNSSNMSAKTHSDHRLISQQGENESNKNTLENTTAMKNTSTKTQTTSCGPQKSIAQRLLDQGKFMSVTFFAIRRQKECSFSMKSHSFTRKLF